jgi:hypothetical protein
VARSLHVYPKAVLVGSSWSFIVKVFDQDTRTSSRFTHEVAAGVTAEIPMRLLKLSYDLTVGDADIDQDVDDAHFVDTAAGGPTNGETLWETWQTLAEIFLLSGATRTQPVCVLRRAVSSSTGGAGQSLVCISMRVTEQ